MSGIAGLLRFSGQAVRRNDLERIANALRPYGPDRSAVMLEDGVGLIHVLMRTTPEDRFDRQPERGASGATITADLRLDNRDNILTSLGIALVDAAAWPDSRILLIAWEKFGDEVWSKIRGPFAVAIWDPRSRTLTLARDHFGLNVVMWHKSERFFAFASMPKGLFALPEVPRRLSEEKFADFLVLNHSDHATTMYRDIYRLRPAHLVKVTSGGALVERRFWSPEDIKPIQLASDEAYAEGLRECLDRSVRRQMRSIYPIGSHLTGGLDSSSISALAARAFSERHERLAAFTQTPRRGFDGPVAKGCYADETPYVEAIKNQIENIDVVYIRNDACDDSAELERFFFALEGPVRNPTALGGILAIARGARAQGRRVLLGGVFGNYTISWNGWSQTADHLRWGRLITAYRQWRLFYRLSPHSRRSAFYGLIVEPLLPVRLANWKVRRRRIPPWHNHAAIRLDFAADTGVEVRAQRVGHDFLYGARSDERERGLTPIDYIGDWLAAEKAVTGVETRYPAADVDVVSFCFGVPPEQYLVENIDRSLIRRAMWGLLPEMVLTNRLSGAHCADWYEKLEKRRAQFAAELAELSTSALAKRAIDFARLELAIKAWPTGSWHTSRVEEEYHFAFTRGVAGARFLRWFESKNSPAECASSNDGRPQYVRAL